MRGLKDKVALITGGAGGIGSATARRFIEEGARVVVADLFLEPAQALAAELGPNAVAMQLDIGQEEQFKSVIDAAVEHFGRLDILFNNAALTSPTAMNSDTTATDIPVEIWEQTLHVNLTGYFFGCRHAIPHMSRNGAGAIVNMASGGGVAADYSRIAYGTSKAGVIAMTKYIATQHGHMGIRCNAIAPGPIITETFRKVAPELVTLIGRHALTKRLGVPDDAASLVAFLSSDESQYITGQSIDLDGGLYAHHAHVADLRDFMAAGDKA